MKNAVTIAIQMSSSNRYIGRYGRRFINRIPTPADGFPSLKAAREFLRHTLHVEKHEEAQSEYQIVALV